MVVGQEAFASMEVTLKDPWQGDGFVVGKWVVAQKMRFRRINHFEKGKSGERHIASSPLLFFKP